jgi:uncharacterized membrane protein
MFRGTFTRISVGVFLLTAVVPGGARGDPATSGFLLLGDLEGGKFRSCAWGISADWSTVVGQGSSSAMMEREAFRWTLSGGMVGLGDIPGGLAEASAAFRTSADGSVIVGMGDAFYFDRGQGFRWTEATGIVGLGFLPGGCWSTAEDVTADGNLLVGGSAVESPPPSPECIEGCPATWTSETGWVIRGDLRGGLFAVTPDGKTALGCPGGLCDVGLWSADAGWVNLGNPGGAWTQRSSDVSDDGKALVVGRNGVGRSYYWTQEGGWLDLGPGMARAISGDGKIVVGESDSGAFIWVKGETGTRLLQSMAEEFGIGFDGWQLRGALDVALNEPGTECAIVGWATNPMFPDIEMQAYLLVLPIPEPATLSLLALGGLALMRRRQR